VRVRELEYPFGTQAALVLHTDGIGSRWKPEDWPGLWRRHPAVIAGAIFRDQKRGRDDATVVAVRLSNESLS
jgi:hypothetical protein